MEPVAVLAPASTRISPAEVRQIEAMAAVENRPRSAMIRILLQEALAQRRSRSQ